MPESLLFDVTDAFADRTPRGLVIRLYYPQKGERRYVRERFYSTTSNKFGIELLEYLNGRGLSSSIATWNVPARPPSAGILDVLGNGKIVTHRRSRNARINPLHHGVPCGYPAEESEFYDLESLMRRESAEELVYVTKDKLPRVIIPVEGQRNYDELVERETLKSAARLGINTTRKKYERVEFEDGPDEVEIWQYEPCVGRKSAKMSNPVTGFACMSWGDEDAILMFRIRRWRGDPENMLPIDAEGDYTEGGKGHFNREIFILDPAKLNGVGYGSELPLNAYEVRMLGGAEGSRTSVLSEPLYPPIFMPACGLRRMLDALGVEGYAGKWMDLEIEREKAALKKLMGGEK